MKKIITTLLFILASLSVEAANNKIYVGASYLNGSGDTTLVLGPGYVWGSTGTATKVKSFDLTGFGIKLGAIYESNDRLEISYTLIDETFVDGINDKSSLDIDYLFTFSSDDEVIPYFSIGIGSYKSTNPGADFVVTNADEKARGTSINYGLGIIYSLENELEIELAYRVKNMTGDELIVSPTTVEPSIEASVLHFSLNYKYMK